MKRNLKSILKQEHSRLTNKYNERFSNSGNNNKNYLILLKMEPSSDSVNRPCLVDIVPRNTLQNWQLRRQICVNFFSTVFANSLFNGWVFNLAFNPFKCCCRYAKEHTNKTKKARCIDGDGIIV